MKKILTAGILVSVLLLNTLSSFAAETPTMTIVNFDKKVNYTDIGGTWYESAAITYGYPDVFGSDDGTFKPNQAITRMEFARLLHKALGIQINYFAPTNINAIYSDIKNDELGADAITDLVTTGILTGKGTFGKDETLRRDEVIHLIINALNYKTGGRYALIKMMPPPFDDDAKIKPEYSYDVIQAVLLKLIKGTGDNFLNPDKSTTRAEAVTIVSRLLTLAESYEENTVSIVANAIENDGGLQFVLTVKNNTEKSVTIHHTSGQKFDYKVLDSAGESLYTWSADKLFMMMLSETVIAPGASVEFADTLSAETYGAIKDKVSIVKATIVGTSDDFKINPDGYTADIRK